MVTEESHSARHWVEPVLMDTPQGNDLTLNLVCEDPERCGAEVGTGSTCVVVDAYDDLGLALFELTDGERVRLGARTEVGWCWRGSGEDAEMHLNLLPATEVSSEERRHE
jgi:hypothetical protein